MRERRYMIVADSHGAYIDAAARDAAIRWRRKHNPETVVHLGDFLDFPTLRRGSSGDDAEFTIADDFNAAADYFKHLRPTDVLFGNHDHRVIRKARAIGMDVELTDKLRSSRNTNKKDLEAFGIVSACERLMELLRPVRTYQWSAISGIVTTVLPGWRLLHGYAAGINAVRKMAGVYSSLICGHLHRYERITAERWPDPAVGVCCPAQCVREMEWNRGLIGLLRHERGFLHGVIRNGKATEPVAELT